MNSGTAGAGVSLLPAAAAPAILPAAMMSAVKRPALVDNKTGLPVYQPLPTAAAAGSTPYHPLSAMPLQPQARYITLPGTRLSLLALPSNRYVHHEAEKREPIFFCILSTSYNSVHVILRALRFLQQQ